MCDVDGNTTYGPTMVPAPAPVMARRSPAFLPRPAPAFRGVPNASLGFVNPGIRRSFVPQPVLSQSYVAAPAPVVQAGFVGGQGFGVPTVTKVIGGAPGLVTMP